VSRETWRCDQALNHQTADVDRNIALTINGLFVYVQPSGWWSTADLIMLPFNTSTGVGMSGVRQILKVLQSH